MFRCQYCNSHIFIQQESFQWNDILSNNVCSRAYEGKHQPQQDASFYVHDGEQETVFSTDTHRVKRVGKMRYYSLDETIYLTTPDLIKAGVVHDIALELSIKRERLHAIAKPRFELVKRKEKRGTVYQSLDEALKEMFRLDRKGSVTTIGEAIDEVIERLATRNEI